MSASSSKATCLSKQRGEEDRKSTLVAVELEPVYDGVEAGIEVEDLCLENERMERKLVRKIDIRLCTIAGVLCSLNLLDRSECPQNNLDNLLMFCSGLISSASVTSIFTDLGLGVGNRYVRPCTAMNSSGELMNMIVRFNPGVYCCQCCLPITSYSPRQNVRTKTDVFSHHVRRLLKFLFL
jgi:hypothetical protein